MRGMWVRIPPQELAGRSGLGRGGVHPELIPLYALVAQRIEQWSSKPKVGGSNPSWGTNKHY
jgi:hypothetical protein